MTPLTPRQQEVCALILLGLTNKEIAIRLRVSWRTVEDHREKIFEKYGVRSAVHLLRTIYNIQPERGLSNEQAAEFIDP